MPYAPNSHDFQQQVARRLQRTRLRGPTRSPAPRDVGRARGGAGGRRRASRGALPGSRPARPRVGAAAPGCASEVDELERSVKGRTESLARRFDRVLRLLDAWGYLDGWALTEKGERLAHLYHECDLLIAEALEAGLLDDLDPAALAGLVSVFTYEHRSSTPPPAPWFPSRKVRERFDAIERARRTSCKPTSTGPASR